MRRGDATSRLDAARKRGSWWVEGWWRSCRLHEYRLFGLVLTHINNDGNTAMKIHDIAQQRTMENPARNT